MIDIYLEDLEAIGVNAYEAAIAAAQEARKVNERRRHTEALPENGVDQKPTMVALGKIVSGKGRILYPEDREER